MLKFIAVSILSFGLLAMAVGYGLIAYKLELPPYHLAKSVYQKFAGGSYSGGYREPIVETDINQLVQVQSPADVALIRDKLKTVLWGEDGYPQERAKLNENAATSIYRNFRGLGQVDEYVHDMDFGLQARMHLFLPKSGNASKLVIYHGAHGGGFRYASPFISPFLQDGYAVLTVSMPLYGYNSRPVVNVPNIGNIQLSTHNQFMYLTPDKGIPVQYFVEPVVVALNRILADNSYDCVSIFGMSGGGWSATIAAAVDDRINDSYSVAGTTPIFIKGAQLDDYEQNTPALYSQVNHFDMYVLASSGTGRKHFQIHNKYDPAYHKGHYTEVYEPVIASTVERIGDGKFKVVMDDTHHAHQLSPAAFALIHKEINSNGC